MLPSFEERSVWVQLVALGLGLGGYFAAAGPMLARGVMEMGPYVAVFAVSLVLLIGVMVAGHVIAAVFGGTDDETDERDRLIGWKAEARSSWVLGAGVFMAIGALTFGVEAAWVANGLLLALFASEMLKLLLQAISYRWGV
ncbi:MAG: hypothetical protein RIE77_04995 [Phycisphaerales bacterium]|jgi:hypothetical protein